jgi:hypothetical protein
LLLRHFGYHRLGGDEQAGNRETLLAINSRAAGSELLVFDLP